MAASTPELCFISAPVGERAKTTQISYDAKGDRLCYGSANVVVLRSLADPRKSLVYTQHSAPVKVAKVAPSGFYCASGDEKGNLRIWATNNEDLTLKLELQPFSGPVMDLAWSPDSERMVVVGEGNERHAMAFLINTGTTVGEVSGHSKKILSCDFKPTRPFRVVTASEDFQHNFYEGPPFKFKHSFKEHTSFVNCVRYSPNGEMYATVGSDKKIFLFDGKTGEKTGAIECDHKGSILACSFSPDNTKLLTASADKSCKLYDVAEKTLLQTFTFETKDLEFMQIGCVFAGERMISLSLNGDINFLSLDTPEKPQQVLRGHTKSISRMVLDTANQTIYTASGDGSIMKWDCTTGQSQRFRGKGHTSIITGLAMVEGHTVLSCAMDNTVRMMNPDEVAISEGSVEAKGAPQAMVSIPGQNGAVVVSTDSIMVLKQGKLVSTTKTDFAPLCVAVSTQGQVAVGGKDKAIHLYKLDGDNLTAGQVLKGDHQSAVYAVGFNNAGTLLASGDSTRKIATYTVGDEYKLDKEFSFHSTIVRSIVFSPDDSLMASGSMDGHVAVWDFGMTPKCTFNQAHRGGVNAVAFGDADTVWSAGVDGCVRAWKIK
eukprot:TRINITY_DN61719_c0_g1_i1.p1 TRINITY_DN61719_c0_g1~~TRINITY_DN61719_c0_g1_i1.p1  ORF type:complete len:613 (+),score=92.04 TRINITY_DN61719_c0_g1_i1:38-1840(+)